MINDDLIHVVFSEEEKTNAKQALAMLKGIIAPKVPTLSNDDRQKYGSVAEQNKLKINKARSYMEQNPDLIPPFIDRTEFECDFQARTDVEDLILQTEDLLRKLTDMKILLDYDNYQDALTFYRSVRYNAKERIGNAVNVYNDLKQFFARPGTADSEPR